MKFKNLISAALHLPASLFLFAALIASAQAAEKPNIVFIFIDDMGYGDIGPFGNTVNQTPHLDRMAREGLKLTQFYVSNTACTPSRSALMTGSYAHRIGMDQSVVFPGEKRGLNPDEITIAEMLKEQGYSTGCFGKWHLGDQPEFLPLAQGFDEYFGIPYSNDMWPGNKRGNPVTNRGPYTPLPVIRQNEAVAYVSDGADQSLLCEVMTDEAVKFIKSHQGEPFFLYLPHAYVHNPRYARPAIYEKAGGDVNRSNVEEVDTSVGRILDSLRELKLDKNTLVIFTSDNGGAGGMSMGPLRGGKGGPKYEGHMREPTLAWWPGTIPAGMESDQIVATIDVLPSLARLTGAKVPDDRMIDGQDALDVLLGKTGATSPHDILYYENEGIRRGDWKLVRTGRGLKQIELYDLKADISEQTDLSRKHPDMVQELEMLLTAHAASIAADTRPAAFVEDAKPIISEPGDLPRLRELMGMPDVRAANDKTTAAVPSADTKNELFDMKAIRDPGTLALEILQDWHVVQGPVASRQKLITINVGELWPGQDYRVPVRLVVPVDRKAKGFHLTGGNNPQQLTQDRTLSVIEQELLKGGVGSVYTVVQDPGQLGLAELGRASEVRFAKSLNPHHKVQYWAWPATMMRAVTAAHAEADHFQPGKVAMSGGSKNGASPSMAIIHDQRMTAVHATVSPIWDSPLRLFDRAAWDELESQPGKQGGFSGGHFGPAFHQAALAAGHTWEDLQKYARGISEGVFISRNLETLRRRGVDMLFHPGTHDFVAYDLAWGGSHHPDIPVYLGANSGHGKKKGHPQSERDNRNKDAFLLRHFFPQKVERLLTAPVVQHQIDGDRLKVSVRFPSDAGEENGRIWWIYDRAPDGSPRYLSELIPDENSAEMIRDPHSGFWTAEIKLDSKASHVDFFSNHRKIVHYRGKAFSTYLSCPYTRVNLK